MILRIYREDDRARSNGLAAVDRPNRLEPAVREYRLKDRVLGPGIPTPTLGRPQQRAVCAGDPLGCGGVPGGEPGHPFG